MPTGEWESLQDAIDTMMVKWLREKCAKPDLTLKVTGIPKRNKYSILVSADGKSKFFTLKLRAANRHQRVECLSKFMEKVVFFYSQQAA